MNDHRRMTDADTLRALLRRNEREAARALALELIEAGAAWAVVCEDGAATTIFDSLHKCVTKDVGSLFFVIVEGCRIPLKNDAKTIRVLAIDLAEAAVSLRLNHSTVEWHCLHEALSCAKHGGGASVGYVDMLVATQGGRLLTVAEQCQAAMSSNLDEVAWSMNYRCCVPMPQRENIALRRMLA